MSGWLSMPGPEPPQVIASSGALTTKFLETWAGTDGVEPSSATCTSGISWLAGGTDQFLINTTGDNNGNGALDYKQTDSLGSQYVRNIEIATIVNTSTAKISIFFSFDNIPDGRWTQVGLQQTNEDVVSIFIKNRGGVISVYTSTGTLISDPLTSNEWYKIIVDNFDWATQTCNISVVDTSEVSLGTISYGFYEAGTYINRIRFTASNDTSNIEAWTIGEVKVEE